MTKANIEGVKYPLHSYFWIAYLTDGTVIPEYDFDNNQHNKAKNLPVDKVTKFSFYPMNLTMIQRIQDVFDEKTRLPLDTRIHTLDIYLDRGERLCTHPMWQVVQKFKVGDNPCITGSYIYYALFKTDDYNKPLKQQRLSGFFINEQGQHVDFWQDINRCPNQEFRFVRRDVIIGDDGRRYIG